MAVIAHFWTYSIHDAARTDRANCAPAKRVVVLLLLISCTQGGVLAKTTVTAAMEKYQLGPHVEYLGHAISASSSRRPATISQS